MITNKTIDKAIQNNYSNFKNDIHSELARRLSENKIIKEYNRQMDYYSAVSDVYNSIPALNKFKA